MGPKPLHGAAQQLLDAAYQEAEHLVLVKHDQPVPEELRAHLAFLAAGGDPADAAAELFGDEEAEISELQRPYLGSSRALRPARCSAFLAELFAQLAAAAGLELCGWDLYHGHMVLFSHAACSTDADLGILFHAKEHPEEFTSRIGRVLPVCSPEAGGLSDPRRGTKLSIAQPSFRDRNFLWLLSLNTTFRVDSSHTSLLAPGAAGSRFFTVDESHFGHQLGTVCYLSQDPAEPKGERDVLCIPCHGFPADWHLAQALRALRALRREAEEAEEAEAEEVEVEAVRRAPLDSELVALLQRPTEGKRLRRLGSPRTRRRLLVHVERELARRDEHQAEGLQRRKDAATTQLLKDGFQLNDIEAAMPLCDGSAMRCEAVLRVAFARYRSAAEQQAAGELGDVGLAEANRVLFGTSPWLGGCPALALRALAAKEPLEEAVARIAAEEEAKFQQESSRRLDAALGKKPRSQGTVTQGCSRKKFLLELLLDCLPCWSTCSALLSRQSAP